MKSDVTGHVDQLNVFETEIGNAESFTLWFQKKGLKRMKIWMDLMCVVRHRNFTRYRCLSCTIIRGVISC